MRLPFASSLPLAIFILAAFAGLACENNPDDVYVDLEITGQPVGGANIDTLWCTFKGTSYNDGAFEDEKLYKPINVNGYFQSPGGIVEMRTYTWTKDKQTQTFSAFVAAPPGHYLDTKYWFVLIVNDKKGYREITSDTADCY